MKRILLLGLVAFSFLAPAGANAAVPCRDKIYNEWYASGKISTSYPIQCYRDALKNIPPDAKVYSNLSGDIKSAMQAAIAHGNDPGSSGPTAVGSGPASSSSGPSGVKGNSKTTTTRTSTGPTAIAPLSSTSGGGGVPTPIIVLGAIAILLALAGLIGTGVQTARKRRTA
ncbi:MAG TPA: hypothetical protein VGU02_09630 [Gaiellaceae bacterium]|nr:hypothetical protein [Gaiellaceae bacterium]